MKSVSIDKRTMLECRRNNVKSRMQALPNISQPNYSPKYPLEHTSLPKYKSLKKKVFDKFTNRLGKDIFVNLSCRVDILAKASPLLWGK